MAGSETLSLKVGFIYDNATNYVPRVKHQAVEEIELGPTLFVFLHTSGEKLSDTCRMQIVHLPRPPDLH